MTDFLLLLVAVFWGTNYAVVKHAFGEIEPQAFNARADDARLRPVLLVIGAARVWSRRARTAGAPSGEASSVFYTPAVMTRREWLELAGLGFVGNCVYQYLLHGRAVANERRQQLPAHRDARAGRAAVCGTGLER